MEINVKNSGLVTLPAYDHGPDGTLVVAESKNTFPFEIKRVYYITNISNTFNPEITRGEHAHKKIDQIIFCIKGSFLLTLDDGEKKQEIKLDSPNVGVRLRPKLWHGMSRFSSDCVILVLSDSFYEESDYIRNYDDFLSYIKTIHDPVQ